MTYQRFLLYTAREKRAVEDALTITLGAWLDRWLATVKLDSLVLAEAKSSDSESAENSVRIVGTSGDRTCAMMMTGEASRGLAVALFKLDRGYFGAAYQKPIQESLQFGVALTALRDLISNIVGSESDIDWDRPLTSEERRSATGSGWLQATVEFLDISIVLYLSKATLEPSIGVKSIDATATAHMGVPLADRYAALSRSKVTGSVHVGHATLRLSEVPSLRPGDLVKLEKEYANPFELCFDGTSLTLRGRLGLVGDKAGIRVEAIDDGNTNHV